MRFPLFFLLLAACKPTSDKATVPVESETGGEGEGEGEGETASPAPIDLDAGTLLLALPWAAGEPSFAGYSFDADATGWCAGDPLTHDDGRVYCGGYTPTGSTVEDAAEAAISATRYGTDKILANPGGSWSIPDAAATPEGGATMAGIAYGFGARPATSGSLSSLADLSISGAYENGYTGSVLWFDADLDGASDDLGVTTSIDGGAPGEIAVFLDAPTTGALAWDDADLHLTACDGATYGSTQLVATDGRLWAGCPHTTYARGFAEGWTLPVVDGAESDLRIDDVSGWYMVADPRGGLWLDQRGASTLIYVSPDLEETAFTSGDDLFGADPSVLDLGDGRVLLAVGVQVRGGGMAMTDTTHAQHLRFAPSTGPRFAPGTDDRAKPTSFTPARLSPTRSTRAARLAEGGDEVSSAVVLCDISAGPESLDLAACAVYEPAEDSGVGCIGALTALALVDGSAILSTSGWRYGGRAGEGCGLQSWRIQVK